MSKHWWNTNARNAQEDFERYAAGNSSYAASVKRLKQAVRELPTGPAMTVEELAGFAFRAPPEPNPEMEVSEHLMVL